MTSDAITLRSSTPGDGERVVEIWRAAVNATHDFLTAADRTAIDAEVRSFLPSAPLTLAADQSDRVLGFALIDGPTIEALFVDPAAHGNGVGRKLLDFAWHEHGAVRASVNEQNTAASGFYAHLGFVCIGRSDTDDQGRPYPLLRMERQVPVHTRVVVRGRVQGVFFRETMRQSAATHEVAGSAVNLPDGSVECHFEGSRAAVDAMIGVAREGSSAAKVDSIELKWLPPTAAGGFKTG